MDRDGHRSTLCGNLAQTKLWWQSGIVGLPTPIAARTLAEIKADPDIPLVVEDITVNNLDVFVRWQEKLDDLLAEHAIRAVV